MYIHIKVSCKEKAQKIENPHPKLSIIPHFIHVIHFLFVEKTIVDISIFIRFTHKGFAVCSGPLASIHEETNLTLNQQN